MSDNEKNDPSGCVGCLCGFIGYWNFLWDFIVFGIAATLLFLGLKGGYIVATVFGFIMLCRILYRALKWLNGYTTKCPSCNHNFCVVESGLQEFDSQPYMKDVKVTDRNGNEYYVRKQFCRRYHRINYSCSKCGYKWHEDDSGYEVDITDVR